ncbi:response regulator [Amantichitinum ursilacus]|uniref:Transcriptional regulatory protein QseB n=1 Tax=Amantichitinum ursilacus TaxID=857265 RepID=A0A0N0XLF8_9NEIS|nr:response regulator transcription factor [Amantichitinum ursilacus]KPC55165.1 Transcriptional regulatory protein QseB [Amantichitinum ursilacus]
MRVLVVEDDRMIGEAVVQALKDAAYATDWVRDGESAMQALQASCYEVLLLDLGLPGRDGLQVLGWLRQRGDAVGVLIVSARDAVEDRIAGLDAGADDYILKPFEVGELLARMRAVARRQSGAGTPTLSNGALVLDLSTREATYAERTCRLSAREFSLLQALLIRPGAILSRQQLEDRIYGWNEEVESNVVEFVIHSLRKKLGSDVIKNVRGLGWMVDKNS